MDILGFNYSPELEIIHDSLRNYVGDKLSVEDIRLDDDTRIHGAYGKHTRHPNGTETIKFNPEKSTEADIAHEYMHALLHYEGFPGIMTFGGENRDAKYLATHIEDTVIHPLINMRLEENGISVDSQRNRTILNTLQALSKHDSEESINVWGKQIKAFGMIRAYQFDCRVEVDLENKLRERLPRTSHYYMQYKNALSRFELNDRLQCQKAIMKLLRICDAQYRNDGDERPDLINRFYCEPIYIPEKMLGKKAKDVFDYYGLDRNIYYDICIRYKREDRLIKAITFKEKDIRNEVFDRMISGGRTLSCLQLMNEVDIRYFLV